MNIKINRFLAVFFLLFIFSSISSSPIFAAKSFSNLEPTIAQKGIKIGAKLREYRPPTKADCDIKVPKQYPTIQAGIDAATAGDTICVDKGTYNENVLVNKSIQLYGKGAKKTTINGQTSEYSGTIRIAANNVIIEGFEINGVGTDYTNAALRISESVSGAIVRYNHIASGIGELVLLTDGFQNNLLVENNILKGNNSPQVAMVNGTPTTGKASDKVDFLKNTFIGTVSPTDRGDTGVVLTQHATNSSIKYNVFNTLGTVNELIQNAYSSESTAVNYNNFNSVAQLWKVSNSVGVLNAEDNWWGDTDPSNDVRNDAVDYTPFATNPFKEN